VLYFISSYYGTDVVCCVMTWTCDVFIIQFKYISTWESFIVINLMGCKSPCLSLTLQMTGVLWHIVRFYCRFQQSDNPRWLTSGRVNDGICDCCDGSDEWKNIQLPQHIAVHGSLQLEFN